MNAAASIIVKGLVQGVGFRYFVNSVASGLGLTGYARNLYSGEVEIHAEGERALIEELIGRVRIGPRAAHVTDVSVQWKEPKNTFKRFEIR